MTLTCHGQIWSRLIWLDREYSDHQQLMQETRDRSILLDGKSITAKRAYYALIESHIRYGLPLWGSTSKRNINRVVLLQKRAIRILVNLQLRVSLQDFQYPHHCCTLHRGCSSPFEEIDLPRYDEIHSHNTQNARFPNHQPILYTIKPSYKGCLLYNYLPNYRNERKILTNLLHKWLESTFTFKVLTVAISGFHPSKG